METLREDATPFLPPLSLSSSRSLSPFPSPPLLRLLDQGVAEGENLRPLKGAGGGGEGGCRAPVYCYDHVRGRVTELRWVNKGTNVDSQITTGPSSSRISHRSSLFKQFSLL